MNKPPIINCHTHVFTADHVPPYLAKTYIPSPLHIFIPLGMIVKLFRWWYKYPAKIKYSVAYKRLVKFSTAILRLLNKVYVLKIILGWYGFLFAFFLLYSLVTPVFPPDVGTFSQWINKAFLFVDPILPTIPYVWFKILLIIIVFIFFDTIRNMILFIAKLLWKALSKLPGKQTKEMAERYLNIGRYAFHQHQKTILSKLKDQYPGDTGFIILPMDMDYVDAGTSRTRYRDQMKELADVKNMSSNKNKIYPFIFADPRRMVKAADEIRYLPGDKIYFDYSIQDGSVVLKDCFMKDYIEMYGFSGIKIYPALGYYPFDEKLLPLWKYAADNQIPIMTHCIRGTIFYRGIKEWGWNQHPIFKQAMEYKKVVAGEDGFINTEQMEEQDACTQYIPLVLPEAKNVNFSYNFTNPLNYLCLLEEELLRQVITAAVEKDPTTPLKELFGYNGAGQTLTHNLRELKICLAHFGGDDEWKRYFEKDRYNYSSQLIKHPDVGIKFFKTLKGEPAKGKMEQLWKHTDWYSIICSMILQYPNVYADISYILHGDQDILPLLKETLQNPKLREKVLYGTDFFVVRNHKSDKNMLADMLGGLSTESFDQIARVNPVKYLENKLP